MHKTNGSRNGIQTCFGNAPVRCFSDDTYNRKEVREKRCFLFFAVWRVGNSRISLFLFALCFEASQESPRALLLVQRPTVFAQVKTMYLVLSQGDTPQRAYPVADI